MTSTDENRFFLPAWGVSLTLHSMVVGLAFAAQVKPILQEEVFKWDVALVQEARSGPVPEQIQSPAMPERALARAMTQPSPRRVVTEVSQKQRPLEQKAGTSPPVIEPIQKIDHKVEFPQVREEPIEQRIVEVAEPAVETRQPEPVAESASPEPVEPQTPQQDSAAMASADIPDSEATLEPVSPQIATANAAPASSADNRWLAESLWRRVAELKRYPNSARMNGQEGKVILKAVIRSDGQLADVLVLKSSGYAALDMAAMEAVKLACPLYMKRAIGKAQIVVSLPIVYSLAN